VRIPDGGEDLLILFPITTQMPAPERFATENLHAEKRRVRLDGRLRLWIILDEYNQDEIGRSFYLEPEPPLGYLAGRSSWRCCKRFIVKAKA
jgi:hypothetical protein